jgi:hypothetical protein
MCGSGVKVSVQWIGWVFVLSTSESGYAVAWRRTEISSGCEFDSASLCNARLYRGVSSRQTPSNMSGEWEASADGTSLWRRRISNACRQDWHGCISRMWQSRWMALPPGRRSIPLQRIVVLTTPRNPSMRNAVNPEARHRETTSRTTASGSSADMSGGSIAVQRVE